MTRVDELKLDIARLESEIARMKGRLHRERSGAEKEWLYREIGASRDALRNLRQELAELLTTPQVASSACPGAP